MLNIFNSDQIKLDKIKRNIKKVSDQDDSFRKTEKFKKMSAEEKHEHNQMFYQSELCYLLSEKGELKTKMLLRKCRKYGIPVPSRWDEKNRDKYWTHNDFGEYRELTDHGCYMLRKKIREERKDRREDSYMWWIPITAVLSGLLGNAVGVISVLRGW